MHLCGFQEGYGVMVLNTNRNYDEVDGKNVPIRVSLHYRSLSTCSCK